MIATNLTAFFVILALWGTSVPSAYEIITGTNILMQVILYTSIILAAFGIFRITTRGLFKKKEDETKTRLQQQYKEWQETIKQS